MTRSKVAKKLAAEKLAKETRVKRQVSPTEYRSRFAYMDYTDFCHELGEASGGTLMYPSLSQILELEKCAKACGVVKVRIDFVEIAFPGKRKYESGISFQEMEDMTPRYVQEMKKNIAHRREKVENLRAYADRLSKICERDEQLLLEHERKDEPT